MFDFGVRSFCFYYFCTGKVNTSEVFFEFSPSKIHCKKVDHLAGHIILSSTNISVQYYEILHTVYKKQSINKTKTDFTLFLGRTPTQQHVTVLKCW